MSITTSPIFSPTPSRRLTAGFVRFRRRWRAQSPNTRATLWMLLSYCFFTCEMMATRMLGDSLPTAQMALVRSAAQLVLLVPFLVPAGLTALRTQHLRLHAIRGLFSVAGVFAFFYTYSQLPLANAVSISFARNLFIVAFAAIVLGEIVRWRRWTATIVGLVGVVVIMRPGIEAVSPAYLVAVFGAAMGAAISLSTRALATREAPIQIMVYIAIFTTLGTAVPGFLMWKTPDAGQAFWLVVIGVFGPIGQYIAIRAFRLGEASALAPVDYSRLLFAVAAGLLVFAEIPDRYTLIGAGIIVSSTLYITYREAMLARSARASA